MIALGSRFVGQDNILGFVDPSTNVGEGKGGESQAFPNGRFGN